jgi:peptide/nickel transport system permease protein
MQQSLDLAPAETALSDALKLSAKPRGGLREVWRNLQRNRLAMVASGVLLVYFLMAVLAPIVAPYDPLEMHFEDRFQGPSTNYFFGTDESGRDLLSRIMSGSRITLTIGFGSILISLMLGIPLGMIAGFVGGRVDDVIMRILDGLFAFPSIILAMVMVAIFGTGMLNLLIAIGILFAPGLARITRSTVLVHKEREYVMASRAIGADNLRIMFRTILPNCLSPIIVNASLSVAVAIKVETALGFLGLGVKIPYASWGYLLNSGYQNLVRAPWYAIFPGLNIFLVILALNLLGDGLRDALEPRLRNR